MGAPIKAYIRSDSGECKFRAATLLLPHIRAQKARALADVGAEIVGLGRSPAAAFSRDETAKYGKFAKVANIRPE
jgi:hypothetical protein